MEHQRSLWVYPRACGGTYYPNATDLEQTGLSPRVRGNQRNLWQHHRTLGSIPARAGEPFATLVLKELLRVYPRACGGTNAVNHRGRAELGLSPRVRGNLQRLRDRREGNRSIPARAGEPTLSTTEAGLNWVYPRACGGTLSATMSDRPVAGLSPRVRGNQRCQPPRRAELGLSPSVNLNRCPTGQVYPRACGGTNAVNHRGRAELGLSPRVRGNRRDDVRQASGVYPRACGGTPNVS